MTRRAAPPSESLEGGLLSIGALAAATGIPPDTIRTWERRYGFPAAERKPSGHRVYPVTTIPRLRRVAEALARGHRAAEVVPASEAALEALLAALSPAPPEPPPLLRAATGPVASLAVGERLEAVRRFDADLLRRSFQGDWARLGPLPFLEESAGPFLHALGEAWAGGSLDIRHEHFGSAVVGDFLRTVRQPLADRARGPVVALATLAGELHGLGLQMSALVFAQNGWRPLILGVDTPAGQLVALAREAPLGAVALSLVHRDGRGPAAALRSLRAKLPRRIPLLVGGAAAPAGQRPGIEVFPDLTSLDRWLERAAPVPPASPPTRHRGSALT